MLKKILNKSTMKKELLHEITNEERGILQKTLVEMLDDISMVCDKYGIKPILVAGSALGAYRHKGFIPWDDDLDIAMVRNDYDRFLQLFDTELSDKYDIMACGYSSYLDNRFAQIYLKGTIFKTLWDSPEKIQGVYVDIFPIDYAPENKMHRFIKGIACFFLMGISSQVTFFQTSTNNIKEYMSYSLQAKIIYYVKMGIGFLFSFWDRKKWFELLDKNVRYNGKSNTCGVLVDVKHYFGECVNEKVFFPLKQGEFEGRKVYLPGDIDIYLKHMYGDNYMIIPPIDKRERHFIVELYIPPHQD